MCQLGEALGAQLTSERPLAGMRSQMDFQVAQLAEHLKKMAYNLCPVIFLAIKFSQCVSLSLYLAIHFYPQ